MGVNNSSIKCVQPMMKYFQNNDKADFGKILRAVILDDVSHSIPPFFRTNLYLQQIDPENIFYTGEGNKEKALWQSKDYLLDLIDFISSSEYTPLKKVSKESQSKRDKLFRCDGETVGEAKKEIQNGKRTGWFVFEGATHPDVFIVTNDFIIIIEAKWTEKTTTTYTTNLKNRDQMIRHIQGAINYKKDPKNKCQDKRIIAFYIVDERFLDKEKNKYIRTRDGFNNALDKDSIKPENRDEIINAYTGYITWQKIKKEFPEILLPKEIEAEKSHV